MQESNDLVTVNFTSRTEQKIKRLQQICKEEDLSYVIAKTSNLDLELLDQEGNPLYAEVVVAQDEAPYLRVDYQGDYDYVDLEFVFSSLPPDQLTG